VEDLHLHEDDELQKLKDWWKNYGIALILGAVIGLGGLFGYRYWTHHLQQRAAEASALYDQVIYELNQGKPEQAAVLGGKVMKNYASTPYAALSAMLLAKASFDKGDATSAERQLRWALEHARDASVQHAARLRLARLLMSKGKDDDALKLVQGVKEKGGFASEYSEMLGDIYKDKGQIDKAREAYLQALNEDRGGRYTDVLQMKLADVGPAGEKK
jgi:predicted negative regulator of RcsB-dependent stress response